MLCVETRYLFVSGKLTEKGETDISNFGIRYKDLYKNPIVTKSLRNYFQPKTAWEDWIFLTHDCNLDCTYCFENKKKVEIKWNVDELINFFKWQNEKKDREYFQENSKIMFYGGEPLFKQELIMEIIEKAKSLPFDFGLQTNGTLLDKINSEILGNLETIFVSVDGSRETHDKNRHFKDGTGSYDTIINNVSEIKKKYNGRILARMTIPITPEYNFCKEIKSIIDTNLFTDYYWQLETPIHERVTDNDIQIFLENYKSGVKYVTNFWVDRIKKRDILHFIPFEAALENIIFDELVIDLKADDPFVIKREAKGTCGCGDKLVVIDLDGRCYPCDTLVGREDVMMGDIWNGVDPKKFIENNEFFVYGKFKGCPRRTMKSDIQIAHARETKGCPAISNDKPDFYCQAAGGFISIIRGNMKDILNSGINENDFFSPISDFTEYLP